MWSSSRVESRSIVFLLYINDLPNISKILKFILFADDTNVFCSHSPLADLKNIFNAELKLLVDWFRINKLHVSLNAAKSCYITFSAHNKSRDDLANHISIDGNIIKQVFSTKFLGIHIDQYLTWEDHIKVISNKISKNLGIIRKIGHLLPTKVLTSLYYTLINPYLLYGNTVWSSNYNSRTRCLVILQKRIIRIIARLKYFDHSHESFINLSIMKFKHINTYTTGLYTYKSLYNLLSPATIKLMTTINEVHEHFTRGSKESYRAPNTLVQTIGDSPYHVGAQLFVITFLTAFLVCHASHNLKKLGGDT